MLIDVCKKPLAEGNTNCLHLLSLWLKKKKKKKKKSVADNKPLEENPSPGKAMKDAFCGYFLLHTWSCQLCLIFFPPLFDLPGAVSCCLNSVKLERRLVY